MATLITTMELSTGHVDLTTAELLDAALPDERGHADWRDRLTILNHRYGWMIRVPVPASSSVEDLEEHDALVSELPDPLAACVRSARAFGARWLAFDKDADEDPTLETYEW